MPVEFCRFQFFGYEGGDICLECRIFDIDFNDAGIVDGLEGTVADFRMRMQVIGFPGLECSQGLPALFRIILLAELQCHVGFGFDDGSQLVDAVELFRCKISLIDLKGYVFESVTA